MSDLLTDIASGENDIAGYMLARILALPAGWVAMKILDWWDNRNG